MSSPDSNAVREEPHSIDAEECLLSSCLLDGSETIAKCVEAGMTGAEFYSAANGVIFRKVLELYRTHPPVSLDVLAEELRAAQKLESVGGISFLLQVSGRVPTTAQAQYWIEKVRELYAVREITRAAAATVDAGYNYQGGIEEFAATAEQILLNAGKVSRRERGTAMEWDALLAFDPKNDPDCLMGNRYLCRTGGAVIAAPSGVGKSVLGVQWAACAALGRHFFGMQIPKPLRVLYVQAEDDLGDVAESVQGFREGFKLTDADLGGLKKQMRIVRWNDAAGEKFLARLRTEHTKWPFDLVFINPLFSFAGCNVMEQADLSAFLRNGLNSILNDTGAAAIIIHHTNKPQREQQAKRADVLSQLQYSGSGSAELTNWTRAYLVLQPVPSAGETVFKLIFAKRGKRTGIAGDDGLSTSSVMVEHSERGLCWIPSDYRPEKGEGGKFPVQFRLHDAIKIYDPDRSWPENEARIAKAQNMTPRSIRNHRKALEAATKE